MCKLPLIVTNSYLPNVLTVLWSCLESSQQSVVTASLLAMLDAVLQELMKRCEGSKEARRRRRAGRRRRRRSCSDATSGSEASAEESGAEEDSADSPELSSCDEGEEVTNGHVNGLNGKSGKLEGRR